MTPFARVVVTLSIATACSSSESTSQQQPAATWECGELASSLCSCHLGLNPGGTPVVSCEGYPCCADGVDADGVSKTCSCVTQEFLDNNTETCDEHIAGYNGRRSRVPACPVE
jgi:hypothetical protein